MKVWARSLLLVILVLAEVGVAFASPSPQPGSSPPLFELPGPDGKLIRLGDFLGKKPVVLVFFASWSKPCQSELYDLQQLATEKGDRIQMLGVSFDKKSRELQDLINRAKITFPIAVDKKYSQLDKFQILVIPTTFCIGSGGTIERVLVDYDDNVKKAVALWAK